MVETLNYNCCDYFIACSEEYGDYDAMEHMGKRTKRSELIKEIDAMASYMQNGLGLKRGDVYTIFLPTCLQSIVAFYALNKIGVIVNFVHPLLPPHVLSETMDEAGSKGIMILDILSKKYVDVINSKKVPCLICRSSDYASPVKKAGVRAGEGVLSLVYPKIKNQYSYSAALKRYMNVSYKPCTDNCDEVAVYLNGGGTTGKSKTIKLTSKAINELTYKISKLDHIQEPGVEASIVVLPLFHAFGLCVGVHMIACNAGRIIPMMQFDPKKFNKLMRKNRIIFLVGIPGMYKKIMHEKHFDGPHLANLRLLFCGGDDASQSFLDEFNSYLEKYNAVGRLRQGYGLTEVGSVCTVNSNTVYKPGTIGWALEGLRIEIWDENHKRVPNGEIGEIAISGSTIMEGYYEPGKPADEGLYTDEEGTKWVLSGDLAKQDDDGYFFFCGRKKRLIIISGYNVYPSDIENKLEELPFIREVCAVQGYLDNKPIIRLYASFRDKGNDEAHKAEIISTCEKTMSKFSVPKEIVVMDELPRTHMKKVDFMKLTQSSPKASVPTAAL